MYSYRPEIKIQYLDVNCALYLLQLSSAQKLKNRHLKQCITMKKSANQPGELQSYYNIQQEI